MEQRLLLAFVLMGLVLFLTPYFYKAPPPPAKKTAPATTRTDSDTNRQLKAPPRAIGGASRCSPNPPQPNRCPDRLRLLPSSSLIIDTDIYHITLSNRGGTVRSWILKKYRDKQGKPLELINEASYSKVAPPFSDRSAG